MRLTLILTIAMLAACSNGGNGGNGPPAADDGLPPGAIFLTVQINASSEFEPNDTLDMAEAQFMPVHGPNADYVGFGIFGDVNDTTDPADYFLFTAERDHIFTVQTCRSFCAPNEQEPGVDTSVAYFEVLDQSGTLLMSSQGDIVSGNNQEVDITAGLVYYLGVFAEDTVGATQGYYVEVVEKLPFDIP